MKCCGNCFNDRKLREDWIPFRSDSVGKCDYCRKENAQLVDPKALEDRFELLTSIYELNETGKPLPQLLNEDWRIFTHGSFSYATSCELLGQILGDDIASKKFFPIELASTRGSNEWTLLSEELKHGNRYFPTLTKDLNLGRLSTWLSLLQITSEDLGKYWYRARVGESHPIADMGPPPKKKSTQGRANPAGIPYLYLASDESTCISEIRPHTGVVVSVAKYEIDAGLKLVDLRTPRETVSPFELEDEIEIAQLRSDLELLEDLGGELTRPVLPDAASIEYVPSQYLCEFIKQEGFDGVCYKSSVGDGVNVAIFDNEKGNAFSVENHQVQKVSVVAAKI